MNRRRESLRNGWTTWNNDGGKGGGRKKRKRKRKRLEVALEETAC